MALNPLLISPAVTLVAMGVVYIDAKRRLPRTRLWWTAAVGFVSQGGFLVAVAFDTLFFRAYSLIFGAQVVVQSPYDALTFLFAIGLSSSVLAVLSYGIGSRVGPFDTRSPS